MKGRLFSLIASGLLLVLPTARAATFLFDATKAEMAGNADWVIDATNHNLRVSSASDGSGTPNVGGNESNPQRYPYPPASGITSGTAETYWQGGLSAWAVDLVKRGHGVETLPYNGRITYQDGTNPQDLTNYNVLVFVEPNILFTATEKAAIVNFVKYGGGLFLVSDHIVADRNNDGYDAVGVLDALMINSVATNMFGILFNSNNISGDSPNPDTSTADPITHGPAGTAVDFWYNNGATITVNTNQNPTVRIAMFSSSTHGTTNGMVVYANYGLGKVVAAGDSSPFDDGTGDPNDSLFYSQGYADPSTSAGIVILNGSLWLAQPTARPMLKISAPTNQIQVLWTNIAVGFALQSNTNLLTANTWLTVTNLPVITNNQNLVTLPTSSTNTFYRLKLP